MDGVTVATAPPSQKTTSTTPAVTHPPSTSHTEDEPFWYGHNPTILELRSPLSAQSCSFQSFQQEPIRPRQEPMKERQEEKHATVF